VVGELQRVDHHVHVGKGLAEADRVAAEGLHHLHSRGADFGPGRVAAGHTQLVPAGGGEARDDLPADEAGPARDCNAHATSEGSESRSRLYANPTGGFKGRQRRVGPLH
jgi:hypothetical protein